MMFRLLGVATLGGILAVMLSTHQCHSADAYEIIDAAEDAWTKNRERVSPFSCILTSKSVRTDITKPRTSVGITKDGGKIVIPSKPAVERRYRIICSGDRLRAFDLDSASEGAVPSFDLLIKGIVTFSIERESIVVRLLSRFPAIAQLDPRDFLSDRCARPFLDDIESIRVEGDSLQYEDADDSVIVRSSFSRAGHSREHAIAFSKRFDMLPTAQWWSLDGAVVSMASCRYAAPLKDAGTVAESVTFRFRPKDRLLFDAFAGDASSTNWGTISETIVSEMRSPSDSELAMLNEIDNHWRLPVVDTRLPAPPRPTIINQDPGPSDAAPAADLSNLRVWLVVLIGTVLIAGVVVLRLRSRAR